MSVINEIARAIKRDPSINRVIVSAHERELLRIEMMDLDPRTAMLSEADRRIILAETHWAKIMVMGRPVETRR